MLAVARGPGSRRSAGIVDTDLLLFESSQSGNYLVVQYSETDVHVRLENGMRDTGKSTKRDFLSETDERKKH